MAKTSSNKSRTATEKAEQAFENPEAPKGGKFKRLAPVTLPTLKFADGTTRYFKFTGPIHVGTVIADRKDKDGNAQKPADVVNATDIETGEIGTVIVGDVLKKEMEKAYPDNGYIGKCFEITKSDVPGKRYKNYTVFEITPDANEA